MSDKDENKTEELTYDIMPGAEAHDDEDVDVDLDLSFTDEPVAEVEEPAEEVEEAEEVVTEVEEAEEVVAEVEETASEEPEDDADGEEEEPLPLAAEVDEETKTQSKPMVPKSRLDEVLAKQKALQKQLDDINTQKAAEEKAAAPEAYDFDEKEVEYQNLVLDGETQKAVALRREIRNAEKAQIEFELREEVTQTVKQDREMSALHKAAMAMQEAYPVFDANSESYNEELTNEVVELRNAFISNGYDVVDALSKAAKFVVRDNGLDVAEEPAKPSIGQPVDEVAKKRKEVSKKLKAAQAQPPELPGESAANHGEKAINVMEMTEEEFDALPEATLKRLRGDII